MRQLLIVILSLISLPVLAAPGSGRDPFAQLGELLPTGNTYRTASGAPGHDYWQQRADYKIEARLDQYARRMTGDATITYTNHGPDSLRYIWLQLDQNRFRADSLDRRSRSVEEDRVSYGDLREQQSLADHSHGFEELVVTDTQGQAMPLTVIDTMGRVDLANPLLSGETLTFQVSWAFNIIEEVALNGRGGYEYFEESDTDIFFIAQWYPRLAAYTDYAGWQHKAFLGRGEFTVEFGDFDVRLTVPANHVVSATGELQNPNAVLSELQRSRLASVTHEHTSFIVTPEEALAAEAERVEETKQWHFRAENVRDFAFASSSKFIWDAMRHHQPGAEQDSVLAMSFYPNEAEPVWSRYSTQAVVHTLDVYSRFSFDYPYPVAQSVNTWESGGMEYPMITFNGYRPDPPKTRDTSGIADYPEDLEGQYSRRIKYGLIGVIIHEIGHIYFPMVVNSDERQWTWMDEGLNTFLEYIAELEWDEQFPAFANRNNVLDYIPTYMTSQNQVPIMTNSESILQFGPNAYSKPAAALTVLRETVMGRELFDFAFREYSRRWQFKRPTPADFFRTMEDASGIDLDWFWRAWFYTTQHVDIGIADIRAYRLKRNDPDIDFAEDRLEEASEYPVPVTVIRNQEAGITPRETRIESLRDFYSSNDRFTVSNKDRNKAKQDWDKLKPWEKAAFERAIEADSLFYFVDFENRGGIPSPLLLTIDYENGDQRTMNLPAEIWRRDNERVTFRLIEQSPISAISLDQSHQTGDADYSNNRFPPEIQQSRLSVYRSNRATRNLMADMLVELKSGADEKAGAAEGTPVPLEPITTDSTP